MIIGTQIYPFYLSISDIQKQLLSKRHTPVERDAYYLIVLGRKCIEMECIFYKQTKAAAYICLRLIYVG